MRAEASFNVEQSEETTIVISREGYSVDVTSRVWKLSGFKGNEYLDWGTVDIASTEVLRATQAFFRARIATHSQSDVSNYWQALTRLWAAPSFIVACKENAEIPYEALSQARALLGLDEQYRFHYIRKWYLFCEENGFEAFSAEVAFHLREIIVGGNVKGEAVRSSDPEEGPLTDGERLALEAAIAHGKRTLVLDAQEAFALELCNGFGPNAHPAAMLQEEDRQRLGNEQDGFIEQLAMPRHKKGNPSPRQEFRERRMDPNLAQTADALIAYNERRWPKADYPDVPRPMFWRNTPRKDVDENSPTWKFRYHMRPSDFTSLVTRAVEKLEVISHRTKRPLVLNTRRFRYTFATQLVRLGASRRAVADALDHSDLQNVAVYFDLKDDIVIHLDRAMAFELGILCQNIFPGRVVQSAMVATKDPGRESRIRFYNKETKKNEQVGTCGSFAFCGLTAPIACYTCQNFQPWMDAPHDQALEGLLRERERKKALHLSEKIYSVLDRTIVAIAVVILRIEYMKSNSKDVDTGSLSPDDAHNLLQTLVANKAASEWAASHEMRVG